MNRVLPNRQGDATRAHLIRTAEKLFADYGVDAVSVRAINAAAGQGAAAVNYHFGTKEDLLSAVLLDLGSAVVESISQRIDRLEAGPAPDLEAVVRALTDPYLELLLAHRVRGIRWTKIVVHVSRDYTRPAIADTPQDELAQRLRAQLGRALPDTPDDRIAQRWPIAVMSFLQSLSRVDLWSSTPKMSDVELIDFYEDLVSFLTGGAERMLR
ncbi:TetR/AcrR family transcriptional regulator [Nocardia sp. NPDC004151]|uniref:TetR/AcrR family transcriptional regulator n=1 Tax=Nocardia sp. NPDC004151 TaxID=3364304 RepID=UPI00369C64F2